ncbi:MAG: hypothetical protein QX203_00185 [Methylococcaceae bacterium]
MNELQYDAAAHLARLELTLVICEDIKLIIEIPFKTNLAGSRYFCESFYGHPCPTSGINSMPDYWARSRKQHIYPPKVA